MYLGQELSPSIQGLSEAIYITRSVKRRFKGLFKELEGDFVRSGKISEIFDWSVRDVYALKHGEYPFLNNYLRIARVMDWDISHDVNYAYAMAKYTHGELYRRLARIYPDVHKVEDMINTVRQGHGYSYDTVRHTLIYSRLRSSWLYCDILYKLGRIEQERHYEDALYFEE